MRDGFIALTFVALLVQPCFAQGTKDKANLTSQVPFFGDLPLLGWLFKTQDVRDNKTELLIFLTPRIISENLTLK
jgi:type IV pilus assembly protein PilQ